MAGKWRGVESDFVDLLGFADCWLSTAGAVDWDSEYDIVPSTGPVVTIELWVGEHVVGLVVSDGFEDSELDEVVIRVLACP